MAEAHVNRRRRAERRKAVAGLAALAAGVAAAGAFLLPRLQTEVPRRPVEPLPGVIEVKSPFGEVTCYPKRLRYRETSAWSACWFHALKKSPWPEN